MFLDWGATLEFFPDLLDAAWLTLYIATLGFCLAVVIAFFVCAGRLSQHRYLRLPAAFYVEVIRNTPLLLQIYLVFYGLPSAGIRLTATNAAIIGIAINGGSYLAEIFRSGVLAIPQGQREATHALGMGFMHRLMYLTVPICLRNVFPSVTNMVVASILSASLASVIAVAELTGQANTISSRNFLTIEVYAVAAGLYMVLTVGSSTLMGVLQSWLFPRRSRL